MAVTAMSHYRVMTTRDDVTAAQSDESVTHPTEARLSTPSPVLPSNRSNGESDLRADVRRVGALLGQALVRQHGQDLLDLVEQVRSLTKESREASTHEKRRAATEAVRAELAELPISVAMSLVRAFSTYFQLANGAEQVHRVRMLRSRASGEGHLGAVVEEIAGQLGVESLAEAIDGLAVQPVFTAHPTEASRRSILLKLRAVADILAVRTDPNSASRERQDRKLAEIVDLLWQTDELRQSRPTPIDEARNALFYLEAIAADTIPEVTDDLAAALAGHGIALPAEATPLRLGSWIGGDRDGNPNVTADITHEVLRLQHQTAYKVAIGKIDELIMALSSSTVVAPVSDELAASIEVDLVNLPGLDPRVKELNSAEPMRLKLTCIKAKLINTRARVNAERHHEPGRDYSSRTELLADLAVISRLAPTERWIVGRAGCLGHRTAGLGSQRADDRVPGHPRALRGAPSGHRPADRPAGRAWPAVLVAGPG